MAKFGWCFIWYGNIANTVAKQVTKGNHAIVAVYGRNYDKAKAFADKYGATAYKMLSEALADKHVNGVYIATPNNAHAEYMEACIEEKKPVLCEKPFALNAKEARRIIAKAKEENVYVAEAMWTWHNKVSLQVRSWIQSGTIGDIVSVEANYGIPMLKRNDTTSRLVSPQAGGGALLDVGIYPIRYVYELFGMPRETTCTGELYNGVDVEETIVMKYDNFNAKLFVSFKKFKGEKLIITGTKGTITVPMFHQAIKAQLKGAAKDKADGNKGYFTTYIDEFDHTAEDIHNKCVESKYVSTDATIATMELLDDCREKLSVVFPQEVDPNAKPLNTNIKAISHIGFNCKDMMKCRDFYCDILGCKVKFELSYMDLAQAVKTDALANGDPVPGYCGFFEKQGNRLWNIYLEWADRAYIELFDQIGAFHKNVPSNHDLNYTHYSIEVEDIHEFRQAIIQRGGSQYIEGEITLGVDKTYQMWLHDPEGNRFEFMEYTDQSFQLYGNKTK